MDWLAIKGGRGAIDLVMHVQEVEFKEAVEWLSGRDLSQRPANVRHLRPCKRIESPGLLKCQKANEIRWDAVRGVSGKDSQTTGSTGGSAT